MSDAAIKLLSRLFVDVHHSRAHRSSSRHRSATSGLWLHAAGRGDERGINKKTNDDG